MHKIDQLYQTGMNIYPINDLRLLWHGSNPNALKSSVKYFVDNGRLYRLRKGIYSLVKTYDPLELGQKLITPSYVSLESALQKHGVIFQASESISLCARYSRTIMVDERTDIYHELKESILLNPLGITRAKNTNIASAERAICGWIYLRGQSHFDNLRSLNIDLMRDLGTIYNKKTTITLSKGEYKLTEHDQEKQLTLAGF